MATSKSRGRVSRPMVAALGRRAQEAEEQWLAALSADARKELEPPRAAMGTGSTHARSLDELRTREHRTELHAAVAASPLPSQEELELADAAREKALDRQARQWRQLPLEGRKALLRDHVRQLWRQRYGFAWDDRWTGVWVRAPWVKVYAKQIVDTHRAAHDLAAERAKSGVVATVGRRGKRVVRRSRDLGARAFAIVWEVRAPPPIAGLPGAPLTGSNIPPVALLARASILAGNWPSSLARGALPTQVLAAERAAIRKVLQRYGLKPSLRSDNGDLLPVRRLGRLPSPRGEVSSLPAGSMYEPETGHQGTLPRATSRRRDPRTPR